MPEIEKDVDDLKRRVNKLENVAYILGGLAIMLGLSSASLYTKLSDAETKADTLRKDIGKLSQDINVNLKTKVDAVIRDRVKVIANELGKSRVVYKRVMAEVPVSSKTSTISISCPIDTLPVGGGFKNYKSAVNLVQIFAEQNNLFLSLDNTATTPDGGSLVVEAWAACLKATEDKVTG